MMHIRPALAALALACASLPAFAQVCFPWADALKIDHEQFGQLPAFIASTDGGSAANAARTSLCQLCASAWRMFLL